MPRARVGVVARGLLWEPPGDKPVVNVWMT